MKRLSFDDRLEGFQMTGVPARFVALEFGAGVAAESFEAVVKELDVAGVIQRREAESDQSRYALPHRVAQALPSAPHFRSCRRSAAR